MSTRPPKNAVRIMVFGTFDGLHFGHLNFLKQARSMASFLGQKLSKNEAGSPYLIVSIARDVNVQKIKGARPRFSEKSRMNFLKKSKLADKIVLGGTKNHIPHILRERPEIIALGYDQKNYIKNLKKDLKNKGLFVKIVRLKPFKEKIYKNHLLKKKRRI